MLFTNVEIGSGAQVVDSVIMPNAVIGEGAKVTRCIVAGDVEEDGLARAFERLGLM